MNKIYYVHQIDQADQPKTPTHVHLGQFLQCEKLNNIQRPPILLSQ